MNDDPDSSRPSGKAVETKPGPDTEIAVLVDCTAWETTFPDGAALAQRAAAAALAGQASPPPAGAELSVVLTDDTTARRLNRDYRGQDRPTNVLAFPAEDKVDEVQAGPVMLGDVVISLDTLLREAAAQGKTPAQHLCHLTVHGVLHLLGYDHATAAEAARMEALETRILAALDVPDPYRVPDEEPAAETVAP